MHFEWDDRKRAANIEKHGIDFAIVDQVFDGRPVYTVASARGSEERWATVAVIHGRYVTAVWTRRGDTIRVISIRKSRDVEKTKHHQIFG